MNTHVKSTSAALAVIVDKLALVYDTEGKILHVHRVTTLQGGKPRSDDEITRAALEHAKCAPHNRWSAAAQVLLVEPHEFKPGHTHRVDVTARALRSEPRANIQVSR